jgi:hypothetical protein
MEKLFKNQGKRQIVGNRVRGNAGNLHYFLILLLRPSTRFFSNQLEWIYRQQVGLPNFIHNESIPQLVQLSSFMGSEEF